MQELKNSIDKMFEEEIIKIVISNKINKDVKYNKINFLLKEDKKGKYYQIERYTDKQVFHENIQLNEAKDKLFEYVNSNYKQVSAWSNTATFDMKISKKGKVFLGKKKSNN